VLQPPAVLYEILCGLRVRCGFLFTTTPLPGSAQADFVLSEAAVLTASANRWPPIASLFWIESIDFLEVHITHAGFF
jgi:hypothetical protein